MLHIKCFNRVYLSVLVYTIYGLIAIHRIYLSRHPFFKQPVVVAIVRTLVRVAMLASALARPRVCVTISFPYMIIVFMGILFLVQVRLVLVNVTPTQCTLLEAILTSGVHCACQIKLDSFD